MEQTRTLARLSNHIVFICLLVALLGLLGCDSNPPYRLDSGEAVVLTEGSGSVACSWEELLCKVDMLVDDVLPYTEEEGSQIDAMIRLHNGLEERGIRAALVAVNVEGNEPFFTCVAVETIDSGLRFLALIPESLCNTLSCNRSEYIQSVYLKKGEKIGFVEAKFALSGDYSWYLDYLARFYEAADLYGYVEEYWKVIEKNDMRLSSIDRTNEEIRGYLEQWQYYTEQREIAFIRRIDRYNSYIEVYNAQIEDYNSELSEAEKLADATSQVIYAFEVDYSYPSMPFRHVPVFSPNIEFPTIMAIPSVPTVSYVDELIRSDDSYNHMPKPDTGSVEQFERISDENFEVDDFKLWW